MSFLPSSHHHGNRNFLPYTLDAGVGRQAAIGLIVLAGDQTIEHEWRGLLNLDNVAFFVNRIHNFPQVTPGNLKKMEANLAAAAGLILPGVPVDVLAYGCTSASILIGEQTVANHLRAGKPDCDRFTTPIGAAKTAFRSLGSNRIALLTPYTDEINQIMKTHLEQAGIEVPVMGSFNNMDDNQVMRISPESIRAAALAVGAYPEVDALFIACTSLRAAALVKPLELQLGKPVTTSCHALAWHALRLAGYNQSLPDRGKLFFSALPLSS